MDPIAQRQAGMNLSNPRRYRMLLAFGGLTLIGFSAWVAPYFWDLVRLKNFPVPEHFPFAYSFENLFFEASRDEGEFAVAGYASGKRWIFDPYESAAFHVEGEGVVAHGRMVLRYCETGRKALDCEFRDGSLKFGTSWNYDGSLNRQVRMRSREYGNTIPGPGEMEWEWETNDGPHWWNGVQNQN